MNTPISYELAKLLKEKGFNKPCRWYMKDGVTLSDSNETNDYLITGYYSAPTIAEVVMWLYENHGIWISVDMVFEEHQTGFWYCIRESKDTDHAITSDEYNTPTEAYEVAIQYCLKNLINQ